MFEDLAFRSVLRLLSLLKLLIFFFMTSRFKPRVSTVAVAQVDIEAELEVDNGAEARLKAKLILKLALELRSELTEGSNWI